MHAGVGGSSGYRDYFSLYFGGRRAVMNPLGPVPVSFRRVSPVLTLSEAVCLLSSFPALAGASLTVDPGEVVLLEGPNGAGKSTLLRLAAGLLPLHTGRGRILDLDLARRSDRRRVRRTVAYLGHHNALYDDLTVTENLDFWVAANSADHERGAHTVDPAVLARLGLDGRLGAVPVRGLSAGQRRRVAMAVVVARRSPVWLLDEPHAGLDADGRDIVDGLVTDAAAAGVSVILSSHELDRSRSLAHRTVRVVGGRIADDSAAGGRIAADPSSSPDEPGADHAP